MDISRRSHAALEQLCSHDICRMHPFQLIRLLERHYPRRAPLGRTASPMEEVARFRSTFSPAFPASDIEKVKPGDGTKPFEVWLRRWGLVEPQGALPLEWLENDAHEAAGAKLSPLRHFLDAIFHRLVSLLYRGWEDARWPIGYERRRRTENDSGCAKDAADSSTAWFLQLMGLDDDSVCDWLGLREETLCFWAGLMGMRSRSFVALEQMLSHYFDVRVRVKTLARKRRRRAFRMYVGPLQSYARFQEFLPGGNALRQLVRWTRFFVGDGPRFCVRLILHKNAIPKSRAREGAGRQRLGMSFWLNDGETRIRQHVVGRISERFVRREERR